MVTIPQGKVIYCAGQKIDSFYIIRRGSVMASYPGGSYTLRGGDVIGICEIGNGTANIEYRAQEEVEALNYPFGAAQMKRLFDNSVDVMRCFLASYFRQFNEILTRYWKLKEAGASLKKDLYSNYDYYCALCGKYQAEPWKISEEAEADLPSVKEEVPLWLKGFYGTIERILNPWNYQKGDFDFLYGFFAKSSSDLRNIRVLSQRLFMQQKAICGCLMDEGGDNLVEALFTLYERIMDSGNDDHSDVMFVRGWMDNMVQQMEKRGGDVKAWKERMVNRIREIESGTRQGEGSGQDGQPEIPMEGLSGEQLESQIEDWPDSLIEGQPEAPMDGQPGEDPGSQLENQPENKMGNQPESQMESPVEASLESAGQTGGAGEAKAEERALEDGGPVGEQMAEASSVEQPAGQSMEQIIKQPIEGVAGEQSTEKLPEGQLTGKLPEAQPVEEPSIEEPAAQEFSIEVSPMEEPSIEEPAAQEFSIEEPSIEEPAAQEFSIEEPSIEEPAAQELSIEVSPIEASSMEASPVEKLPNEESSVEEPSTENVSMEEPAGGLDNSLDVILDFAGCEKELAESFRAHVEQYKKMPNKGGTEDDIRALRQKLTKEFNQVYCDAFISSLEKEVPKVVRMFFAFGYVDEELAGKQNAIWLYNMVDRLPTDPGQGVYTIYQWLQEVYAQRKEPSRNEFDTDFMGYLIEQKRMGEITEEEQKALYTDSMARVKFELENLFPVVNKITFGRLSTFCPLYSENNVLKPMDSMLVSAERIAEILRGIREKDYGAYYRETMYSNPEAGVPKEMIHVEILPDFILMPNVGNRGVMWQEIEGKRRNTPARMLFSIFQLEDLEAILIRLTGEFRWEMCKRIQGARWNDLSEKSLTSEYFDYIQFYKKNSELSTDAKEKIKTDLGRTKNNFKEMFLKDYLLWIMFESNSSPRLNKVARGIFFTYCTFTSAVRQKLRANPLYQELVDRGEIKMKQKRHKMEMICQKLSAQGREIPEEIQKEMDFMSL